LVQGSRCSGRTHASIGDARGSCSCGRSAATSPTSRAAPRTRGSTSADRPQVLVLPALVHRLVGSMARRSSSVGVPPGVATDDGLIQWWSPGASILRGGDGYAGWPGLDRSDATRHDRPRRRTPRRNLRGRRGHGRRAGHATSPTSRPPRSIAARYVCRDKAGRSSKAQASPSGTRGARPPRINRHAGRPVVTVGAS